MKKIQDGAMFAFIIAVGILTVVSILGVWKVFGGDVIGKSTATLALLAFVTVIVMTAGRFMESRPQQSGMENIPEAPSPLFKSVRGGTLILLIVSVSLLALLGVLSIWEVIADKLVLYRSLGSLGIVAFAAFIVVMMCLEREGKLGAKGKHSSVGMIIGVVFLVYFFLAVFGSLFR